MSYGSLFGVCGPHGVRHAQRLDRLERDVFTEARVAWYSQFPLVVRERVTPLEQEIHVWGTDSLTPMPELPAGAGSDWWKRMRNAEPEVEVECSQWIPPEEQVRRAVARFEAELLREGRP